MTKCYKVLRYEDGKLFSVTDKDGWEVLYSVGKVVQPIVTGTKLFVFDTYSNASDFARIMDVHVNIDDKDYSYVIFECECTGIIRASSLPKIKNYLDVDLYNWDALWKNYRRTGESPFPADITGTLLVDSLTLLGRVDG